MKKHFSRDIWYNRDLKEKIHYILNGNISEKRDSDSFADCFLIDSTLIIKRFFFSFLSGTSIKQKITLSSEMDIPFRGKQAKQTEQSKPSAGVEQYELKRTHESSS